MKQPAPARFAPLLAALSLALLVSEPLQAVKYGSFLSTLLYPITLAALIVAVGRTGRAGRIAMGLWVATVVVEITARATVGLTVSVVGRAMDSLLVAWCSGILLMEIVNRRERVTFDTLLGGVAVYLMIGFFYSLVFALVEMLLPGSFLDQGVPISSSGSGAAWAQAEGRLPGLLYFSFVTLTTLGYGDIVPDLPLARSLAASEALIGQLYLTILVAALVGMHMSQRAPIPRAESRADDSDARGADD